MAHDPILAIRFAWGRYFRRLFWVWLIMTAFLAFVAVAACRYSIPAVGQAVTVIFGRWFGHFEPVFHLGTESTVRLSLLLWICFTAPLAALAGTMKLIEWWAVRSLGRGSIATRPAVGGRKPEQPEAALLPGRSGEEGAAASANTPRPLAVADKALSEAGRDGTNPYAAPLVPQRGMPPGISSGLAWACVVLAAGMLGLYVASLLGVVLRPPAYSIPMGFAMFLAIVANFRRQPAPPAGVGTVKKSRSWLRFLAAPLWLRVALLSVGAGAAAAGAHAAYLTLANPAHFDRNDGSASLALIAAFLFLGDATALWG